MKPEQLEYISDIVTPIYSALSDTIIKNIVRRIVKNNFSITETAKWEILKAQEAGALYDDIISEVASATAKSEKTVVKLFSENAVEAVNYGNEFYKNTNLTPVSILKVPHVLAVLNAGLKKTNGTLKNLTKTTAQRGQEVYISACDSAYMQIISGAVSYNEAVLNAVSEVLNVTGYIKYPPTEKNPAGTVSKVDTAVRRAVLTGVNQTMAEVTLAAGVELDCDLVEVTAHAGARPEHADWQGSICSISGKHPKYPKLKAHTGYGSGEGLCGWNCRHSFFLYIENSPRVYTAEYIKKLDNLKVTYNGNEIDYYKATQKQRSYEVKIREVKRTLIGLNEISDNPKTDSEFQKHSVLLKKYEAKYADYCEQTGLPHEADRLRVVGFNKSLSQKIININK